MADKDKKPEEKPEKNIFEDINRYFPALAALRFKETDPRFMNYALMDLADSMGKISSTEKDLLLGSLRSEDGLNLVMNIYPKKYNEEFAKANISQFLNFYNSILSKYADKEDAEKINGFLLKNGGLKMGDLEKKIDEIDYKLKGHKKGYSKIENEDEVKKLEKTLKDYQNIRMGIGLIQENSVEELRLKYFPRYQKDMYKEYASGISESSEKTT